MRHCAVVTFPAIDFRHIDFSEKRGAPVSQPRTEILSLQYLRALAALAVAVSHAAQIIPIHGRGDVFGPMPAGAAGVDVFFVISGYIMCHITKGAPITGWAFFKHRLARVAPSYWFITAFVAFAMTAAPTLFNSSIFDVGLLLKSLLFLPAHNPSSGELVPLVQIGWTLNYEFFYYSIFAFCLAFGGRHAPVISSTLLVAIAASNFVFQATGPLSFYTNTIILEFVFGMITWAVLDRFPDQKRYVGALLIAVGLVLFYYSADVFSGERTSLLRPLGWGVPAWALVTGAIIVERSGALPKSSLLKKLGDASYSIYLTHIITLGAVRFVWGHFHLKTIFADIYLMVFALVATIIVAVPYYELIEKPSSRLFRKAVS